MSGLSAMRTFPVVQVDVFTQHPLRGNPLAVVLDAAGLDGRDMQAIAREMNLSETTFVLAPARPDCAAQVRIFTPAQELPFAGHPTIGTSWVLASRGRLPGGAREVRLEEGIGPVSVELEGDPVAPSFVWMEHPTARFGPPILERAAVAAALNLTREDLLPDVPICTGSTGVEFMYVPLRSPEVVDRANLDVAALWRSLGEAARVGVFVFAPDPDRAAGRVYSRMFAPHTAGIAEDPATGSASGPLGVYLLQHGLVERAEQVRIVSEQGTRMGRQSFIHIHLDRHAWHGGAEQAARIRVGGSVVPVLDGVLRLP